MTPIFEHVLMHVPLGPAGSADKEFNEEEQQINDGLLIDLLFKTDFISKLISISKAAIEDKKPSALVYLTKLGSLLLFLGQMNEDYAEFLKETKGWSDFYVPTIIETKQEDTWEDFKKKKTPPTLMNDVFSML
jgi:hypothetical protein